MTRRREAPTSRRQRRRRLRLEPLESRRVLATFMVNTISDVVDPNDALTSLREAVAMANASAGADAINFDAVTFDTDADALPSTIQLALGPLRITDGLSVFGPGQHLLRIDANANSRVIDFDSLSGDLTLQGITISGGQTIDADLAGSQSGAGVRFLSDGVLTLNQSAVLDNQTLGAGANGGGIFAPNGDVVVSQSIVTRNTTGGPDARGGGVFVASGTLLVVDSEVSGNQTQQSGGKGGGIFSSGTQVSLVRSTIADNRTEGRSADGGAVFSLGGVTVDESKVTGNTTAGDESDGGAIFANNTLAVLRSDVSGNATLGADSGGGGLLADSATIVIDGSSIADNRTSGEDSRGAGLFAVRSGVTITGSTISGNTASGADSDGGGIGSLFSTLSVTASTVTLNRSAGRGGGIFFSDNAGKRLNIANSIVAANTDAGFAPDISPPANPSAMAVSSSLIGNNGGTSLQESQTQNFDGNFIGDPSGGGVIDPQLQPLSRVGITQLHPLSTGSPAIDTADNSLVATIGNDQRGAPFKRINNLVADMGAVEQQAILPNAFLVNTTTDEMNYGNDLVSLREAIHVANGSPGSDTIEFSPVVIAANQATQLQLGELTVTDSLTIQSPTGQSVTIDGRSRSRIFNVVEGSADLELSGLRITGGLTTRIADGGGGIQFLSSGTLSLRDTDIVGNQTFGDDSSGGGVFAPNGHVEADRVRIVGNSTTGTRAVGGGIHAGSGITASDSTFTDNTTLGSQAAGGGIFAAGTSDALSLQRSTVAQNRTFGTDSHGGGIAVESGSLNLVSSTVSTNAAMGDGGGIHGQLSSTNHQITASTIARNTSGSVGGGVNLVVPEGGAVTVANSIIAENVDDLTAPDVSIAGATTLLASLIGNNLGTNFDEAQSPDVQGNLIGAPAPGGGPIDPLLGPLETRGGGTPSHGLQPGSPAIDAGNAELVSGITTDQRGAPFSRTFDGTPDIGSFETQTLDDSLFVVTTVADELDFSNTDVSLREAIEYASGSLGVETIRFDGSLFSVPRTIELTLGELTLPDSMVIAGPGQESLSIDAQGDSRVFNVRSSNADIVLSGMTITGGRTFGDNDQEIAPNVRESTHSGAAIRFDQTGSLTLDRVTVRDNHTEGDHAGGGGVYVGQASLVINRSTLVDNSTAGESALGGGLAAVGSDVSIVRSSVTGNRTTGGTSGGGGLFVDGILSVTDSSISSNSTGGASAEGGGVQVLSDTRPVTFIRSTIDQNVTSGFGSVGGGVAVMSGTLEMANSTVSQNRAGSLGGGIAIINDTADPEQHAIVSSTVTQNRAQNVGGIYLFLGTNDALRIDNSIAAGNQPSDGPIEDLGLASLRGNLVASFSLIGDNNGTRLSEAQTTDASGNLIGSSSGGGTIAPMLGPLANNGGLVRTHQPLTASPVIDAGSDALAVDFDGFPLQSDGRGAPFGRFSGTVDMGSFEVQPPQPAVIDWANPQNIFVGTQLSRAELNAATDVPGTFEYSPALGTVLPLGNDQTLSVQFTPNDTTHYTAASASVEIDVVDRADLGDAPDTYGTLRSSDGPRHLEGSLRLGADVDVEVDGQPSANADAEGTDDDGVTFVSDLVADTDRPTTSAVAVTASTRGFLDAWIDFDGNGVFDHPSEHINGGSSLRVSTGSNTVPFTIPAGAATGLTFARFRLSSDGGLLPTGEAADGEVEDHAVTILDSTTSNPIRFTLPRGSVTLKTDASDFVVERLGTEIFRAPVSAVSRYDIAGDSFSNVLSIDNSGGNAIPIDGLTYDGGDRVNTVQLVGPMETLDLTTGSNILLTRVGVIDVSDAASTQIRIDSESARRMDARGGGIVVIGGDEDTIEFADGPQWRMAEPIIVAGFVFRRVTLRDTFVQTDFLSPWQNLAQTSDVNNDGNVTAGDALQIVNELTRNEFSDAATALLNDPSNVTPWPNIYFDQNGDGRVTALDALRVINEIARQSNAEGEFPAVNRSRGPRTFLAKPIRQTLPAPIPLSAPVPADEAQSVPLEVLQRSTVSQKVSQEENAFSSIGQPPESEVDRLLTDPALANEIESEIDLLNNAKRSND